MHYATFNIRADIDAGNRGFLNTWELVRFETRAERDAFVQREQNRDARAVTRREANRIYRSGYKVIGDRPPVGGLFAGEPRHVADRFYNNWRGS